MTSRQRCDFADFVDTIVGKVGRLEELAAKTPLVWGNGGARQKMAKGGQTPINFKG
ncbi:hypothetical protein ACFX5Q_29370 [Mesorhizobium sp. IMUNJ 23033]|uniref:hypothetical protein n=1 Tax=Mesorhizobium sp. IMUNJ 23033 TaxID=3378039 RepID=UPI00384D40DC